MNRKSSPPSTAFTLIELLVVIAIIAILAAILFPVFAQAREKARQTACLSNTRQISLAINQYIQDYDELLPFEILRTSTGSTAADYQTWDEALYTYTKSAGIYLCPSDTVKKIGNNGTYPASYFCNSRVLRSSTGFPPSAPFALAQFPEPSNTIAMAEVNYTSATNFRAYLMCNGTNPATVAEIMIDNPPAGNPKARIAYNRHAGGSNYVFIDGHAKWYRLEQTLAPVFLHGPCQ
jgi:prepilin-type N-terminal cleavage/methylation domain-containing protein/prepilin-type processing-associated H-X9-DG protein